MTVLPYCLSHRSGTQCRNARGRRSGRHWWRRPGWRWRPGPKTRGLPEASTLAGGYCCELWQKNQHPDKKNSSKTKKKGDSRGRLLVAGAGSRAALEANGFIVLVSPGAEEVECLGDGVEEAAGETGAETAVTIEFTDKCLVEGEDEVEENFRLTPKPPRSVSLLGSSASRLLRCWFFRLLLKS